MPSNILLWKGKARLNTDDEYSSRSHNFYNACCKALEEMK